MANKEAIREVVLARWKRDQGARVRGLAREFKCRTDIISEILSEAGERKFRYEPKIDMVIVNAWLGNPYMELAAIARLLKVPYRRAWNEVRKYRVSRGDV